MANKERGEVAITVERNGVEKEYTLRMSTNDAVKMEAKMKKSIGEILRDAGSLHFLSVRSLFFVLLQKYHRDEIKTEEDAGNFIDDAGGTARLFKALEELNQVNAPDASEGEGNPPAAQGGTGETSI